MTTGKAYILTSGQGTTNSYVYGARFGTLGYAKVTVGVENVGNGSGVSYVIRGYPVEGFPRTYILASSSVTTSGTLTPETLTDAWAQIDVGVKSLQSAFSSIVTIYATGKRR